MRRLGAGLIAGLWGLAGAAAAQETPYTPSDLPPPGEAVCAGGICQVEALEPVFAALAEAEAGERERPVHILQIGDSHTAGDGITGRLRSALQARFGRGGRGLLPAGPPYAGYAPFHVEILSQGWPTLAAALQATRPPEGHPFGLGAVRAEAQPTGWLELRAETGTLIRRFGVCGWPKGGGDGLIVEPDSEPEWTVNFNPTSDDGSSCILQELERPASSLRLRGTGPGAVLDTVWLEGASSGVAVSGLGLTGATLRDFASRSDDLVAGAMAISGTSLVVLAFGVNEGFDQALDPVAYEQLLRSEVERMRRLAPWEASLMILGAPDALKNGVADGCSADGQRAPPPTLAMVRDVQRRVAADMGVAFWDWHGRMGGDCSADRLALRDEPLVRGDRVHFTSAGADWIGGILADDLLGAYEAWKAGQGGAD